MRVGAGLLALLLLTPGCTRFSRVTATAGSRTPAAVGLESGPRFTYGSLTADLGLGYQYSRTAETGDPLTSVQLRWYDRPFSLVWRTQAVFGQDGVEHFHLLSAEVEW